MKIKKLKLLFIFFFTLSLLILPVFIKNLYNPNKYLFGFELALETHYEEFNKNIIHNYQSMAESFDVKLVWNKSDYVIFYFLDTSENFFKYYKSFKDLTNKSNFDLINNSNKICDDFFNMMPILKKNITKRKWNNGDYLIKNIDPVESKVTYVFCMNKNKNHIVSFSDKKLKNEFLYNSMNKNLAIKLNFFLIISLFISFLFMNSQRIFDEI